MTSALRDEIALRQASIDDARREFAAGEMTETQFTQILTRESDAIARCEAVLGTQTEAPDTTSHSTSPPRRHRRGLLYAALACFSVAVVATLITALVVRQPGTSITGGISLATAQQVNAYLAEGEIDQATKNDSAALVAYNSALKLQSTNIEALTQSGWLEFLAGSRGNNVSVITVGEQRIESAVNLAPTDSAPRLYYAIIAASTPGERALAKREFRLFLTLKPTTVLLAVARPWLTEFGLPTQ